MSTGILFMLHDSALARPDGRRGHFACSGYFASAFRRCMAETRTKTVFSKAGVFCKSVSKTFGPVFEHERTGVDMRRILL